MSFEHGSERWDPLVGVGALEHVRGQPEGPG